MGLDGLSLRKYEQIFSNLKPGKIFYLRRKLQASMNDTVSVVLVPVF